MFEKAKSRQCPTETITDADFTDNLAQGESLHHSLEERARGISLCVNAGKTEYICNKQDGVIPTLSGKPLKLVEQFKYLIYWKWCHQRHWQVISDMKIWFLW